MRPFLREEFKSVQSYRSLSCVVRKDVIHFISIQSTSFNMSYSECGVSSTTLSDRCTFSDRCVLLLSRQSVQNALNELTRLTPGDVAKRSQNGLYYVKLLQHNIEIRPSFRRRRRPFAGCPSSTSRLRTWIPRGRRIRTCNKATIAKVYPMFL